MAQRRLVIPVASYIDVLAGLRAECRDMAGVEFRGLEVDLSEDRPLTWGTGRLSPHTLPYSFTICRCNGCRHTLGGAL